MYLTSGEAFAATVVGRLAEAARRRHWREIRRVTVRARIGRRRGIAWMGVMRRWGRWWRRICVQIAVARIVVGRLGVTAIRAVPIFEIGGTCRDRQQQRADQAGCKTIKTHDDLTSGTVYRPLAPQRAK